MAELPQTVQLLLEDESEEENDEEDTSPPADLIDDNPPPAVESTVVSEPEDDDIAVYPILDPLHYDIPECAYVVSVDKRTNFDLKFLGIRIHTLLRHIICLSCSSIVAGHALGPHLKRYHCYDDVDPNIGTLLSNAYNLETSPHTLNAPPHVIPPIAGIPLHPRPMLICGVCHHGFKNKASLKVHCSKLKHGKGSMKLRYISYTQHLSGSSTGINVPVEIDGLLPILDLVDQQVDALHRAAVGNIDYTNMAFTGPSNELTMRSFFRQDGWTHVVEGFTPLQLKDARRIHDDDDHLYAFRIRVLANLYFKRIHDKIGTNLQFGLGPKLASVHGATLNETGMHNFSCLSPPSQDKYASTIAKLVFSVIRFYVRKEEWSTTFTLPAIDDKTLGAVARLAKELYQSEEILAALSKKNESELSDLEKKLLSEEGKKSTNEHHLNLFHTVLFKLFMHQRVGDQSPFFSPVIVFYVIHMVGDKAEIQSTSTLTNIAAHIMYAIRGCMGLQALADSVKWNGQLLECLDRYLVFLQTGRETIMVFFYNSLRYLVAVRKREENKAQFVTSDPLMREMVHKGVAFKHVQLKEMIDAQLERYDSALKAELLFGEDVVDGVVFPKVDFDALKDDLNNRQRGYTFLMEPDNGFLKFKTSYFDWLMSNPGRQSLWMSKSGHIQRSRAKAWLESIASIEVILAVGILISSGPSPRNTEFVRQLLRQELDSARSFMIIFHCLSFTAVTDKNSHQHGQDKFVPHTPSRRWAVRAIQHMVTLRPFAEFLVRTLYPTDEGIKHRYHFQLWPTLKGTLSENAFSNEMSRITYTHLGVSFRVKQWRQLTTLFAHHIQRMVNIHYPENLLVDILNMHSTKTSNSKYGGSGSLFTGSDPRSLACLVEASIAWHSLIGIDQDPPLRCGAPGDAEIPVVQHGTLPESPAGPDPWVMDKFQRLENLLLALEQSTVRNVELAVASAFVAHRPNITSPPVSHHSPPDADPEILVQAALLNAFRLFLHDRKATFRTTGQAQLVGLGYENKQNVLAAIRTSSGKTASTLFLASISPRITVVFVPLVALRNNILDDARAKGVTICQYEKNKTNTAVNVIVFALEHLAEEAFIFLKGLTSQNKVERVVFDEVHLYLTQRHFRPAFAFLHRLRELKVPIIYLSASVPPSCLPDLQQATGISWTIIRESSNRPEIKYNLVRVPTKDDEAIEAIRYIALRRKSYGPADRGLVFCRSLRICAEVSVALGVPAYYSSLDDDIRKEIVSAWVRGDFNVLVNTPCLGTGFHYPSVRDVVHISGAYTMIDQYQEDSRGGRDGQECNATVFFSVPLPEATEGYTPDPVLSDWLMESGRECTRIRPSLYLDGAPKTCITLGNGAATCSVCDSQLNVPLSNAISFFPAPPVVPSTPVSALKRPLELSPDVVPVSDKRMRERTGSGNIPLLQPVTIVRSGVYSAFNVAEVEVAIKEFREDIEAPLEILLTEADNYCMVCSFTKKDRRVKQAPHGTNSCKSGFHAYLQSGDRPQKIKQLNSAFDFPYAHACTTCGLPIRPNGAHLNPIGDGCPEKSNFIRTTMTLFYLLGGNGSVKIVPAEEMATVHTYAAWCARTTLAQPHKYGKVPVYNYWILTLRVWGFMKNQTL